MSQLFCLLPQIGEFLDDDATRELLHRYPRALVADAARAFLSNLRVAIAAGAVDELELRAELTEMRQGVGRLLEGDRSSALRQVVNATGVILQTNLGRAPLSENAIAALTAVAGGYSNLEYDLNSGHRGKRGAEAEKLLLRALGCDAAEWQALVVNNCAGATLLALNSLAEGGEVIVSRGELVEIGGGFRVPEILRKSGAHLREVGTTNKTRIEDYRAAITPQTRLILRVHRSNFEIVGFTHQPETRELVELGVEAGIPVFEDQGTGAMVDAAIDGAAFESSYVRSARSGVSLTCASGDKLLGGPQCGLIAGKAELIATLRANPLYRALRVDKLTLAALEATLLAYVAGREDSVPVVRMLRTPADAIRLRCEEWQKALQGGIVVAEVVACKSVVGGGTTPGTKLESFAVALGVPGLTASSLAAHMRRLEVPIIARIHEDRVLLDLRTVNDHFDTSMPVLIRASLDSFADRQK